MIDALSSCIRLRVLTLFLPYEASSISQLTNLLASDAFDTRSRRGLNLEFVFERYPACITPTAGDWHGLDDALQTQAHEFLGRVTITLCSMIIPGEGQVVWGNAYACSHLIDESFQAELPTLLPRTHQRQLLWWWHPFDPKASGSYPMKL